MVHRIKIILYSYLKKLLMGNNLYDKLVNEKIVVQHVINNMLLFMGGKRDVCTAVYE